MPHKQHHRGAQSDDHKLFRPQIQPLLKAAVYDYCFLLTRGYAEDALFKLVGDRYQLTQRQRFAVMRCACSTQSQKYRQKHHQNELLNQNYLLIDGFNLLITIESALAKGVIFEGRDGCFRDLASIHSTYKRVEETETAIQLIGDYTKRWKLPQLYWYLDQPVSNSGRLKQKLMAKAREHGWNWEAELVQSPDYLLKQSADPVVTTDSYILDHAFKWVNLGKWLIESAISESFIVSLKPNEHGLEMAMQS